MSKVALSGNVLGTGTITLAAPNTNSTVTLNLPAATGTLLTTATAGVPVNGPAFSAYANANQTVTTTVETKVQLNIEEFDTASCFDSATNYRFTPNVAGYYQINGIIRGRASTTLNLIFLTLFKNGSAFMRGTENQYSLSGGGSTQVCISAIVYLNGTTDYIELYGRIDGTGTCTFVSDGAPFTSRMNGCLVRSAT